MISKAKWYAEGLKFECTQCGNCCSGPPGYVWVSKQEIAEIAEFIGRKEKRLGKDQVRRVGFKHSLTEKPDGDCIFLKREGGKSYCSIYAVRPHQCRTWPFWSENLKSEHVWNTASNKCPGMNRGRRYDFVAIEELRITRSR